jgi:DNA gyrase subunit A
MIIRFPVAGVRTIGRSTQGVKLMDIEGEDRIVALAKVVEEEEELPEPPDEGSEPPEESGDGEEGAEEIVH